MKKLSILFLLMLFTLGVSAQVKSLDELSPEKTYTIRNPHHNAYAIYERSKSATKVWIGGVTKGIVKNVSYRAAVDTTSPSAAWMIVKHNNKWYAFNMQAKKLLSVGNTIASTGTIYAKLDNDAEPLDIKPHGNGTFTILTTRGSNQYLNATPDLGYPVSVRGLDNGSTWEFKEVKEVAPDYNACMKAIKASMPTTFDLNIANGFAWAGSSTSRKQLPHELAKGKAYTFYVSAPKGWICPDGLTIDNGFETFTVNDIKEGDEVTAITIPANKVMGTIMVTGSWQRDETNIRAQKMIFNDDFERNGEPDQTKWRRCVRKNSTWNRFCSDSWRVVYNRDGYLHCRAIKNPQKTDTNPGEMISGGIKSEGKFDFKYGRVEARIKCTLHTGTFPAFWMKPNIYPSWPEGGEIDIWEVINNEDRAYGTVHNSWACCTTGRRHGDKLTGIDYDDWHVMTLDWDENNMSWYVDGKYMWTYSKSSVPHGPNAEIDGWPYDKEYYLILNQSVGDGSWASKPDINFVYETLFDWVRVYQTPNIPDGIEEVTTVSKPQSSTLYDLSGRPVSGKPTKGIYIQNNKLVMK